MPRTPAEDDTPSVPHAGAEVRDVRPCALCGAPTLRDPVPSPEPLSHLPGLCACGDRHERILREAMDATSPSTVLTRRGDGAALAMRAYGKPQRVTFVVCTTGPSQAPGLIETIITPREAKRLAGALLRAARVAEGQVAVMARA